MRRMCGQFSACKRHVAPSWEISTFLPDRTSGQIERSFSHNRLHAVTPWMPAKSPAVHHATYSSTEYRTSLTPLLFEAIYPEDAYKGKTYWADLPQNERTGWITKQSNDEARRELSVVWQMFKLDPLRPFSAYFQNYAITGLGFFVEGYTLFSVGNLNTLFQSVWPACFKQYKVCNKVWVESINYLEIVGIILGQIIVGIIGDR